MKKILLGLIVVSLSALGYSQPFNTVHANQSKELVLSGADGSGTISLAADVESVVVLQLRNTTKSPFVATHMGFGNSAVLVPIAPIALEAGGVNSVSVRLDGRKLMVPCELWFYFLCEADGGSRLHATKVRVTIADTVLLLPRVLSWREGGAPEEKKARIVSVPQGVRIVGARSSDAAFAVRLVGNDIFVKPAVTAAAKSAAITIITEPTDAKVLILNLTIAGKSSKE